MKINVPLKYRTYLTLYEKNPLSKKRYLIEKGFNLDREKVKQNYLNQKNIYRSVSIFSPDPRSGVESLDMIFFSDEPKTSRNKKISPRDLTKQNVTKCYITYKDRMLYRRDMAEIKENIQEIRNIPIVYQHPPDLKLPVNHSDKYLKINQEVDKLLEKNSFVYKKIQSNGDASSTARIKTSPCKKKMRKKYYLPTASNTGIFDLSQLPCPVRVSPR